MNGYVMVCGEKRYATNADNMMEAEDKLFEFLENNNLENIKCNISQVESLENLRDNNEIVFF